jgi:D-alanine-D-alanine ligase
VKIDVLHTKDAQGPPPDPVLSQLEDALHSLGHETRLLMVDDTIDPLLEEIRNARPDLIFNLAESFGGKSALESNVAALLNLLGLRYTGSSPAGLLLAGDKSLTKKMLSFHGINTPEFATVYRGRVEWAGAVEFPLIVKPPQEDASLGITQKSVVHDVKELLEQIASLQEEFQQPVLAERFIDGREFYVGVLGNDRARALPIIELDFSKFPKDRPRIASYEAKWGEDGNATGEEFEGTASIFPTDVGEDLGSRMQQVAVDAFHALRLRDYGRIDLRVTPSEQIYVIEVNPNCYLESESEFARAAAKDGLSYSDLVREIMELASARYSR